MMNGFRPLTMTTKTASHPEAFAQGTSLTGTTSLHSLVPLASPS